MIRVFPGCVAAFTLLVLFCAAHTVAAQGRFAESRNHEEAVALDGHTHMGFSVDSLGRVAGSSIEYLSERGFRASVFAMPVDRSETENLVERLTLETEQLKSLSLTDGSFELAASADHLLSLFQQGRTAIILGLEYFGGVFADSAETVDHLKALGVVYITLVNNKRDQLMAEVGGETRLTELGRQVVSRMNEAGVLVDISHLEEEEMLAVIEASSAPVIASHANPSAVGNPGSELTATVLRALAAKDGLVLVSFNKSDLFEGGSEAVGGVERLVDHFDYLREVVGVDRIGIGSDLQAFGRYVPEELGRDDVLKRVSLAMTARGYTQAEIGEVFLDNFLEVWSQSTK